MKEEGGMLKETKEKTNARREETNLDKDFQSQAKR